MADYRRMVSYMYQYEDGVKKKNVGFARIEARGGQCKLTLHMQLLGQLDSIFPTYLIQRKNNNLDLIYLGDSVLKSQVMDSKLFADERNVMGSGYALSDMGGILIFLNDKVFFATEWDDKPVVAKEVLEALRPKPMKHSPTKEVNKMVTNFREETEAAVAKEREERLKEELNIPSYMQPGGWKMVERQQAYDQNKDNPSRVNLFEKGRTVFNQDESDQTKSEKTKNDQVIFNPFPPSYMQDNQNKSSWFIADQMENVLNELDKNQLGSNIEEQNASYINEIDQVDFRPYPNITKVDQVAELDSDNSGTKLSQLDDSNNREINMGEDQVRETSTRETSTRETSTRETNTSEINIEADQVSSQTNNSSYFNTDQAITGSRVNTGQAVTGSYDNTNQAITDSRVNTEQVITTSHANTGQAITGRYGTIRNFARRYNRYQRQESISPNAIMQGNSNFVENQDNQDQNYYETLRSEDEFKLNVASESLQSEDIYNVNVVNENQQNKDIFKVNAVNENQQNEDIFNLNTVSEDQQKMNSYQGYAYNENQQTANVYQGYTTNENQQTTNEHQGYTSNENQQKVNAYQGYMFNKIQQSANEYQGYADNENQQKIKNEQDRTINENQSNIFITTEEQKEAQSSADCFSEYMNQGSEKNQVAPMEEQISIMGAQTPAMEEQMRIMGAQTPTMEEQMRVMGAQTPMMEEQTPVMEEPDSKTAKNFFDNYPRIYPFEDNDIIQCVKIEPKDIGLLPKEIWPFNNNSFLMHGFYCYHHLIFAKMKNRYGYRYIMGVPGVYHGREQFMARMFGFENFKSIKKRELQQGDFGYWYLPVYL